MKTYGAILALPHKAMQIYGAMQWGDEMRQCNGVMQIYGAMQWGDAMG
jgi:hypothetical protein